MFEWIFVGAFELSGLAMLVWEGLRRKRRGVLEPAEGGIDVYRGNRHVGTFAPEQISIYVLSGINTFQVCIALAVPGVVSGFLAIAVADEMVEQLFGILVSVVCLSALASSLRTRIACTILLVPTERGFLDPFMLPNSLSQKLNKQTGFLDRNLGIT